MFLIEFISDIFDNFMHAVNIKHNHGGRGTRNINREMWARQAYERDMKLNNSKLIQENDE